MSIRTPSEHAAAADVAGITPAALPDPMRLLARAELICRLYTPMWTWRSAGRRVWVPFAMITGGAGAMRLFGVPVLHDLLSDNVGSGSGDPRWATALVLFGLAVASATSVVGMALFVAELRRWSSAFGLACPRCGVSFVRVALLSGTQPYEAVLRALTG